MSSSTLLRRGAGIAVVWLWAAGVSAQPVPRPFPKPGDPAAVEPGPPGQAPTEVAPGEPSEATLGLPVYPGATYLASYDAGQGQRYYLFGTNAPFGDIVSYYKIVLKKNGDLVFDMPPIHTFEVGRFREETMAFPPGVTVKDYAWNGSEGYLDVKDATGTRYRTIIQIVPVPAGG